MDIVILVPQRGVGQGTHDSVWESTMWCFSMRACWLRLVTEEVEWRVGVGL